ncbi:radical SAM family heme chaperone HemW [Desertivirga brevis]|uniref:radical SAM family heme chaperone HemW n=1 Tax=Desertivirga brevis TaxID=2810310 RepID=UPI001A97CA12|nr:radical SAM family heme chaperone HemW [Pedobacter sp. SYSU D00873]
MAGIYLHIPFCKKACHYCDFHFTTSFRDKDVLLKAMHDEIRLQKNFLEGSPVDTIYFGGGTPSVVGAGEIQRLIDSITALHEVKADAEITLETNPDDLESQAVKELRQTQVNRFSIGVQSFYEEDLIWMNRAHNSQQAEASIKRVQDAGFENITADLIYGYPLLTDHKWKNNIHRMVELAVPHISAYSMTVEQRTALAHFIKSGKQAAMNDQQSAEQFVILIESLESSGFEHYEISNFAKPGYYSKHNANYWKGVTYLGLGPSAHSFNGTERQWNIANNSKYIKSILDGVVPADREILSKEDRFNEYIMTSLRTIWGTDLLFVEKEFGSDFKNMLTGSLQEFQEKELVTISDNKVRLTKEGKLFADHIASELFISTEQ